MWPALLEPWGRACRRRAPSSLAEGPVGVDGRGGIKGGPEPRRSSGDGSAQCRGPLQQVESRDFEGVRAGCTLSPCPLQTAQPHTRSSAGLGLGILPRTVRSRELPGTILRGRARGVQLCRCEGLPPWPPYPICECVGFPGSKGSSQKLVRKKSAGRKIPDPCFPLLDLPLLCRAGEQRAGVAPVAGN